MKYCTTFNLACKQTDTQRQLQNLINASFANVWSSGKNLGSVGSEGNEKYEKCDVMKNDAKFVA